MRPSNSNELPQGPILNPNLVVPQMNRNLTDLNGNIERQKQTSLGREKEINSNRISDIESGRMKLKWTV